MRNKNNSKSIETHCIGFYVDNNNVAYFDSLGVKRIRKKN